MHGADVRLVGRRERAREIAVDGALAAGDIEAGADVQADELDDAQAGGELDRNRPCRRGQVELAHRVERQLLIDALNGEALGDRLIRAERPSRELDTGREIDAAPAHDRRADALIDLGLDELDLDVKAARRDLAVQGIGRAVLVEPVREQRPARMAGVLEVVADHQRGVDRRAAVGRSLRGGELVGRGHSDLRAEADHEAARHGHVVDAEAALGERGGVAERAQELVDVRRIVRAVDLVLDPALEIHLGDAGLRGERLTLRRQHHGDCGLRVRDHRKREQGDEDGNSAHPAIVPQESVTSRRRAPDCDGSHALKS